MRCFVAGVEVKIAGMYRAVIMPGVSVVLIGTDGETRFIGWRESINFVPRSGKFLDIEVDNTTNVFDIEEMGKIEEGE